MAMSTGATLIGQRCSPYGAETGGPKRLMGGLYGPKSARTPDMALPQAVEEGEWACDQPAQVRVRMTCRHGHRGQVMPLCSFHDVEVIGGEFTAGEWRQVKTTKRVHGHLEEIQRRQAGFCPPCGFPNSKDAANNVDYAALQKEWEGIGQSLHAIYYSGDPRAWYGGLAQTLRTRREDIGRMFDEGRQLGIVHNCALQLIAVS
jgi:hypothetical protein